MYPAPGAGHLIPPVDLARLLVSHGLSVTIVLRGLPAGDATAIASSVYGDAPASHFLSFHSIPEAPLPPGVPEGDHVVFELTHASNPGLRDFLCVTSPAALLFDFFCYSAADVGAEVGIPTYFFFLGCTASLAVLLHLPVIHAQNAMCFEQIKEMAAGLEMSGQRFLWVVRSPPGGDELELDALLPDGFFDRTKDRGLVVMSWAPQRQVLAHGSVGGFVTHCRWNSVLEAVMSGVPMLGWPLYAEQRINRVFLVEAGENGLVTAEEGRMADGF